MRENCTISHLIKTVLVFFSLTRSLAQSVHERVALLSLSFSIRSRRSATKNENVHKTRRWCFDL